MYSAIPWKTSHSLHQCRLTKPTMSDHRNCDRNRWHASLESILTAVVNSCLTLILSSELIEQWTQESSFLEARAFVTNTTIRRFKKLRPFVFNNAGNKASYASSLVNFATHGRSFRESVVKKPTSGTGTALGVSRNKQDGKARQKSEGLAGAKPSQAWWEFRSQMSHRTRLVGLNLECCSIP